MTSLDGGTSPSETRLWTGAVGQTIGGRYRLRAPLCRGGMGEVWRAKHLVTGRKVALKLLNRRLSEHGDMRRRFLREARLAAQVVHPHVIEVLDAFEDDGLLALVMPLLEGEVLTTLLQREGPLSTAAALELFLPLLSAVEAAHAQGIVHRDLKPDNVFLVNERQVKVLDFGIAKLMKAATLDGAPLTAQGVPIGTLCYMAPEQCLGDSHQDHLVDVWALGVILYELLAGRRPIEGHNLAQVMKVSLLSPIVPLHELRPDVPADVSRLVSQMLSIEKADRPQSLQEVGARLTAEPHAGEGRSWLGARRDRASRASWPSLARSAPIGSADTVRLTDHSMLSSVRPPVASFARYAWPVTLGFALTALALAIAKRSPTAVEATEAGVAAASTFTSRAVPPPSPAKPAADRAPSTPSATSLAPRPVPTSAAVARRAMPLRAPAANGAASTNPAPLDPRPPRLRTSFQDGPRPIDTTNPFTAARPPRSPARD